MPSASSRFRKHGIYTMDVRKVGMRGRGMGTLPVPGGGSMIPGGFSPSISTPKAVGGGWGAVPGTVQGAGTGMFPAMYRDRIANAARDGAGMSRAAKDSAGIAAALLSLRSALLGLVPDGNQNVSAASVKSTMDFILANDTIVHRLNDGLVTYWPGQNVETIETMLVGNLGPGTSSAGMMTVSTNWQSHFNPTAPGGNGATNIGTNAGASSTPAPVQSSQDARVTQIDAGGTSPYYGPAGDVTPSGPQVPSLAGGLPPWLVPVLAAMGGAALGAVTIRALVG